MSSIWKKPNVTPRYQELTWMNLIHQSHDQFCQCEDADLHFLILLNRFGGARKPESDISNIKCLLTGDTSKTSTTETAEEDIGIDTGDLEKLFEEDIGEPSTAEDVQR